MRTRTYAFLLAAVAGPAIAGPLAAQSSCKPLETAAPNAADQKPAVAGQTRACGITDESKYSVTVVATGLVRPWAVEPLPGGDFLVSEKGGNLRIVSAAGKIGEPISGVPEVLDRGQGGLLDVALSPRFDTDRTIFWSYSEQRESGNATTVARGTLSPDRTSLGDVKVIFRVVPTFDGGGHFGSRLAFGPDGMLYISTGDRQDMSMRPHAQQLNGHIGKILRIAPDGSVPKDNPFHGKADAKPEIWDLGHRNVQSLAFDANGQLWSVEHGPRGGDELNRIEKGKNYGWPVQSYGLEYSGQPISSALGAATTTKAGIEPPVYYWDPVIAPAGMQFYTGSAFPGWKNNLFIGSMVKRRLVRLVISGNKVTGEEHLLGDRNKEIRDVRQGPDGALYVVTDESNAELLRIAPR
jgi:glucose/arabinose dehydrogenase